MGGYLASRLLKHCSQTFDRVTDSLIFNMDWVSNGWAAVDSQEVRAGENALRAVPTNACFFNTSTNFSSVKM
jgi:hypothetical protein